MEKKRFATLQSKVGSLLEAMLRSALQRCRAWLEQGSKQYVCFMHLNMSLRKEVEVSHADASFEFIPDF